MKAILRFDNVDVYREGEFADTEPVTIGREPDNKVAMQLGVLSRHHAKVFFENGGWFVQDLDSANGSFFRGKQLAPNAKVELVNGDLLESYGELEALKKQIQAKLKSVLGLQTKVTLVQPKTLERFQGKAKRILDLRNETK